ncbi:hypothetical protein J1605_006939 [Eschrichtius robustus]|uniref:Uncharacterized protein n=1 Tax=Eschrichtius robustus TaxID=9764 RepID=A0AB34H2Q7_ESCRO|nr:hypothetical protein J1605_006939 [Eschrichtius robustus]
MPSFLIVSPAEPNGGVELNERAQSNLADERLRAEQHLALPLGPASRPGPSGAERGRAGPSGAERGGTGRSAGPSRAGRGRAEPSGAERGRTESDGAERRGRAQAAATAMKRDRLGRFLSPGVSGQRGSSGGGSCGRGRARGRPSRSGPDVAEAAALVAARLGWGPTRACADAGEDGADEAAPRGHPSLRDHPAPGEHRPPVTPRPPATTRSPPRPAPARPRVPWLLRKRTRPPRLEGVRRSPRRTPQLRWVMFRKTAVLSAPTLSSLSN